jgi:hypothetical protein
MNTCSAGRVLKRLYREAFRSRDVTYIHNDAGDRVGIKDVAVVWKFPRPTLKAFAKERGDLGATWLASKGAA